LGVEPIEPDVLALPEMVQMEPDVLAPPLEPRVVGGAAAAASSNSTASSGISGIRVKRLPTLLAVDPARNSGSFARRALSTSVDAVLDDRHEGQKGDGRPGSVLS